MSSWHLRKYAHTASIQHEHPTIALHASWYIITWSTSSLRIRREYDLSISTSNGISWSPLAILNRDFIIWMVVGQSLVPLVPHMTKLGLLGMFSYHVLGWLVTIIASGCWFPGFRGCSMVEPPRGFSHDPGTVGESTTKANLGTAEAAGLLAAPTGRIIGQVWLWDWYI